MEETLIDDPRFHIATVYERLVAAAHRLFVHLYWKARNLPVRRWLAVATAVIVYAAALI